MTNSTTQYIAVQPTTVEYEIKKSRFIGMIVPSTNEAEAILHLQTLAAQHPHANHLAFAWRIRQADGFINERCHDAGEPSGTAGRPILAPLQTLEYQLNKCHGQIIDQQFTDRVQVTINLPADQKPHIQQQFTGFN